MTSSLGGGWVGSKVDKSTDKLHDLTQGQGGWQRYAFELPLWMVPYRLLRSDSMVVSLAEVLRLK